MNLSEFTRIEPFSPEEKSTFREIHSAQQDDKFSILNHWLDENGWISVNPQGKYSRVFENPNKPYILKLNNHYDRAFSWFLLLTRKFPNQHFPRFMDVTEIGKNMPGNPLYLYKMERLDLLPYGNPLYDLIDDFWTSVEGVIQGRAKNVRDIFKERGYEMDYPKKCLSFLNHNPDFEKALNILGEYSHGFSADMHQANFMLRGKTLVINDPFQ